MAADPAAPTWSGIRDRLAGPSFGSATRSRVGVWVTEVLEQWLGPDWPAKAAAAGALEGLPHIHSDNRVFFDHLRLALQLESVRNVPGRKPLVHSLRSDFGPGRRLHVETQLEVATLAITTGWKAVLEERGARQSPPLDVVLRRDDATLPIEVKVVLTSDHNEEVHHEVGMFDPIYMELLFRYDVILGGTFPGVPSESGRSQLRSLLEPVAVMVAGDHMTRYVEWNDVHLSLTWLPNAQSGPGLSMPMPLQDDRERLPQKIGPKTVQATKSGARWLRLDMVGGYFQMSPWWNQPFGVKLDAIVSDLIAAGTDSGFDGIVVSSGVCLAGRQEALTIDHPSGAVGLVRQVTPIDARTTVVVPLNGSGSVEVPIWSALYDEEQRWLDWALAGAGLPALADLLRSSDA